MVTRLLLFLVTASGLLALHAGAQGLIAPNGPSLERRPEIDPIVFDLATGGVLGVKLGMNEEDARKALAENHVIEVRKLERTEPKQFSLETKLGVTLWFRGSRDLNDIYTNSANVKLSNGLKVGQTVKEFTALLGQPVRTEKLPSGKHTQIIYEAGAFDLGAICADENPDVVRAIRLLKRGLH